MPTPPQIYAEWVPLLERFAKGENDLLPLLQTGRLEWTAVVSELFVAELQKTINARMKLMTTALNRDLSQAPSMTDIGLAVTSARHYLEWIAALSFLPVLPPEVAEGIRANLKQTIERMQNSLEESAKKNPNLALRDPLRDLLIRTPFRFPETLPTLNSPNQTKNNIAPIKTGRKIIF